AFLNGKRTAAVHRLRAKFDLAAETVRLRREGEAEWEAFPLRTGEPRLTAYLSDFFGTPVTLIENDTGGFPDDTAAPGPTVLSAQTLAEVASWFGLTLSETRRRFRANLEIDADAPFWEDRLFGPGPPGAPFRIGDVSLVGTNPCARCVVPSRSADGGEPTPLFAKTFARRRAESLPHWAPRERFNHFFRLAVNTRVVTPAAGAVRVGDAVQIDA
ncbi:MAG: MOSC domain-containing protein, partial [Planctomycetes bacterium]|nr:MOSC domain-containing protein [Planctomycetota bacterium]